VLTNIKANGNMASTIFTGVAPGRLDVMGGIADYSGSLVLQLPISEKTTVAFQPNENFLCEITSTTSDGTTLSETIDFRAVVDNTLNYDFSRKKIKHAWYGYVLGCAIVLKKEKGIRFTGGVFNIHSEVPLGKGVSSSASLEVATMKALASAFNISFQRTELALLAQRVENQIVGAPCGLMDQLATSFGNQGQFLPIICQPDQLLPLVDIPPSIKFFGIDSGVRHSVGGASYGDVRCAAFMGYTIIANSLGISRDQIVKAKKSGNKTELPFQGYLSNIPISLFENNFLKILPASMSGKDFIDAYGDTIDNVTSVNPETNYAVRQATLHPVLEMERVSVFKSILEKMNQSKKIQQQDLDTLGMLMLQSHKSYSDCGLGSDRTDEIVSLANTERANGIYGAKITGGGSGGTVCILAFEDEGELSVRKIHQLLCEKYKTELVLFQPSR
jgi:galactokinase